MARTLGSVNKTSLNLTKYIRDSFTEEDGDKIVSEFRKWFNSTDEEMKFKAIKLWLERFTLSSDKLMDDVLEDLKIETREDFDRALKELMNEQSTTTQSS